MIDHGIFFFFFAKYIIGFEVI